MKSNVYQFPGKQVQEQTAAPPARTLNKEQRERMAAASRQINAAFAGSAAAARAAGATAIGKQPAFGPYKMPILYDKGEVIHTVGQFIDKLRKVRPYTQNSTEFRCDPLGLAVYVAPHTFIKDGVPRTAIRVVAYDYNKTSPSSHISISDGEVYNRLITILTSTYNRLNREYNIASIDPASIVLVSDNPKVPNIPMLPDTKC